MKKKLTTFMFGLLLAVGWTNVAQAQLLPTSKEFMTRLNFKEIKQEKISQSNIGPKSEGVIGTNVFGAKPVDGTKASARAPRRASFTEVADAVHTKAWYDQYSYYWYNEAGEQQTAKFTDPAKDPRQIWSLVRTIYNSAVFPGIKYSKPYDTAMEGSVDLPYDGVDFGWFIGGDITEDITIDMTGGVNLQYVKIYDSYGNLITSYDASQTWNQIPSGWTDHQQLQRTSSSGVYYWYWSSSYNTQLGYQYYASAFTISKDLFTGKGPVIVEIRARRTAAEPDYFYAPYSNYPDWYRTGQHRWAAVNRSKGGKDNILAYNTFQTYTTRLHGPIATPPTENGYTVMIVKLKDEVDYENTQAPEYTNSQQDLYDYFNTYVDEVQLLTDGLRVGQNIDGQLVDGGTLFSYSGTLNRFYFIGKGKMATIGSNENSWYWDNATIGNYTLYNQTRSSDRAPFYAMYEEFSPTEQDNTTGIDDFYAKMVAGESYHIKHDCMSVNYMEHFFSMSGKSGTDPKSVSNLVFYIPDYRGTDSTDIAWRNYDINNQPRVGLYTIRLQAEAERAANYDKENPEYTVTVTWQSNLSSIVDNQVPQTYELYEVVYDENGNIVERKLLTTTQDITSYTYNVPQRNESYTITYQVKGYPTNATNKDSFFAWSNFDDVVIPGLFDFLLLKRDHYESDFVISQLKNYYRNYIYPTNLAPNTGMTVEQLKQDWPEDQIAKYTLYRDHTGIAQLWVRAIGKKVYYKITYIPETQDTTGPNNININNTNN